jgi:hypothetical protein
MVLVAASVKDDFFDTQVSGALRHEASDDLGRLGLTARALLPLGGLLQRRGARHGMSTDIVYHLGIYLI